MRLLRICDTTPCCFVMSLTAHASCGHVTAAHFPAATEMTVVTPAVVMSQQHILQLQQDDGCNKHQTQGAIEGVEFRPTQRCFDNQYA